MNPHTLLNQLRNRARFVRGRKVVIDRDVAVVFGVSAEYIRRVVGRNKSRFPSDFVFKANKKEYAFSEEGVLMLSSVLKTSQAVQTSIEVVRELFGFRLN